MNKEYRKFVQDITNPNTDFKEHAFLGIAGEAGELIDLWKKHKMYNQKLNYDLLKEELGDLLYYITLLIDQLPYSQQCIVDHNIKKLLKRYPNGVYTDKDALERKDKDG